MKKLPGLLATLPFALLLAACGGSDDASSSATDVVASFYPLQYVAEQVGGDLVSVTNLTSPGGEPHDLELKPRQIADIQEADVVVYEKDFQTAVDDAVEQADREAATTVDAAEVVTLLGSDDDHDEEHEEGHDEAHGEDDHDHGDVDPHVWLDPTNMVKITAAVEKALAQADPDNADTYAANAAALTSELTALDDDFTKGLADCRVTTIVTSHAAFAYLAHRYDLDQVAIAGIDPSNEPSAGQLADISELVRTSGITTVFTEELVSPAIARTVADETGVDTATLDPIEGLSDDTQDETYLTLMRKNLAALQKANSCS